MPSDSPISGLSWGLVSTMVGLISGLTKPTTRGESLRVFVFVGAIPLQLSDLLRPRCCKERIHLTFVTNSLTQSLAN